MTLLDTSAIEHLRASRQWTTALSSFHLVKPFATTLPPHTVPGKLKAAGFKVAVVTSSPRNYAESLLKKFGVAYDVLVAYHDTVLHKPDAAPLKKALADLGVKPDEALSVGDHPYDLEAAIRAGTLSVCAGWGLTNHSVAAQYAPDVLLMDPSPLLAPATLNRHRFFGERMLSGKKRVAHGGSVLPCGGSPLRYATGRYFASADPRRAGHALSAAVLDFKTAPTHASTFAKAAAATIKQLDTDFEASWVTCVPPKPSQKYNRFDALFEHLGPLLGEGEDDWPKIEPKGLTCLKEIDGYKQMNPSERALAVKGAFKSNWKWEGSSIWLLDDVLTTGATVDECASVLLASGAGEVRILGLAADQRKLFTRDCPECGRPLKVKTNRWGTEFIGCKYPECDYAESI